MLKEIRYWFLEDTYLLVISSLCSMQNGFEFNLLQPSSAMMSLSADISDQTMKVYLIKVHPQYDGDQVLFSAPQLSAAVLSLHCIPIKSLHGH